MTVYRIHGPPLHSNLAANGHDKHECGSTYASVSSSQLGLTAFVTLRLRARNSTSRCSMLLMSVGRHAADGVFSTLTLPSFATVRFARRRITAVMGPYPSQKQSLGSPPTPIPDVPLSAVFLACFLLTGLTHMKLFQDNRKKNHRFLLSGAIFGTASLDAKHPPRILTLA